MSKSLGNVLDPFEVDRPLRHRRAPLLLLPRGLLRAGRLRLHDRVRDRYESELANEYGNLASRTTRHDRPLPRRRGAARRPRPELHADFDGLARRGERRCSTGPSSPRRSSASGSACAGSTATSRSRRRGSSPRTTASGARARHRRCARSPRACASSPCCSRLHAGADRASCSPRSAQPRHATTRPPPTGARRGRRRCSASSSRCSRSGDRQPHAPRHVEPRRRPSSSPTREQAGVHAHPHDRHRRQLVPRRARRAPRTSPRCSPRSAATPTPPTGFDDADRAELRRARRARTTASAIGETGLDYYRDRAPRADQARAFPAQIELARELGKPRRHPHARGRGRHPRRCSPSTPRASRSSCTASRCPTASTSASSAAGGSRSPATSPTRRRPTCARPPRACPLDRLLVETDAPYLAPQPVRGKPNEPRHVVAHRARSSPSCAASPTRSSRRRSSATPPRCSAGERAEPAQPSLRRLRAFGIPPNRELGQNFLIDSNLLGVIGRAARARRATTSCSRSAAASACSPSTWPSTRAHVHVVEVDRAPRARAPRRARPAPERDAALRRRARARPRRARPGADEGRRQPALRRRRHRDPAHARAAPERRRAGSRWSSARWASGSRPSPGTSAYGVPSRARPARGRRARAAPGVAQRLLPGAERRLRAGRAAPPRPGAADRATRDARAGRLRPPAQGAGRARSRSPGPTPELRDRARAALEAMGLPADARAERLTPQQFADARGAAARMTVLRARAPGKVNLACSSGRPARGRPARARLRSSSRVSLADELDARARRAATPTRSSAPASRARTSPPTRSRRFRAATGWDGAAAAPDHRQADPGRGGHGRRLGRRRRRPAPGRQGERPPTCRHGDRGAARRRRPRSRCTPARAIMTGAGEHVTALAPLAPLACVVLPARRAALDRRRLRARPTASGLPRTRADLAERARSELAGAGAARSTTTSSPPPARCARRSTRRSPTPAPPAPTTPSSPARVRPSSACSRRSSDARLAAERLRERYPKAAAAAPAPPGFAAPRSFA